MSPPESSDPPSVPARPPRSAVSVPSPATERGLEPTDALSRYMAELAHHAPISRDEEQALAVRWRDEGDADAGRQLVLANLRLVVKIAMEYRRAWTNVLDLIQEGNLGLVQAVQRFDPTQGAKLSSYGAYWIRAYILKYLLDNIRMVRLGRSRAERKLFFRLNKEKRELERQGFRAEPALLAERLDVSEEDVVEFESRLAAPEISTNAPARRDDEKSEMGDFLPAPVDSAEDAVGDAELRRVFLEKVQLFAEGLDEREQKILRERMLAEEPRKLADLGEEFGVSRERVRQLEARLLARMQTFMREELPDFELYAPEDGES